MATCAASPRITTSDLIVHKSSMEANQIAGSLTVAPVKSKNQSSHFRKPIDTKLFQQALTETLQESGLFSSVSAERGSNLTIESEIIYEAPVDVYSVTVPLLIHYKLVDVKSKKTIWKTNTFSQPSIPYKKSEAGMTGETRHNTMVRAAVRDSFEQVLVSLHQFWQLGSNQ